MNWVATKFCFCSTYCINVLSQSKKKIKKGKNLIYCKYMINCIKLALGISAWLTIFIVLNLHLLSN